LEIKKLVQKIRHLSGLILIGLIFFSCKKKCWQCIREENNEPILKEICNDNPDYNRQALENYRYACTALSGKVIEIQ